MSSDVYVINLDSRPERWKKVQERFEDSPLKLQRISAVKDGNGAYGNYMSFLKALRQARKEGLSSVLILEDDCLPARGWETRWKAVKGWLDANTGKWDIYSGGAWGGNEFVQNVTEFLGFEPEKIGTVGTNTIFKYPSLTLGAHWIYVPERSYTKMIRRYESLAFLPRLHRKFGMDFLHGFFFRILSSYPFIAYQESSNSNIDKKFVDKRKFITNSEKRVGHHFTRRRKI